MNVNTVVYNTKSTQKVERKTWKSEIKFWVIDSRIIDFQQNSESFENSEFSEFS